MEKFQRRLIGMCVWVMRLSIPYLIALFTAVSGYSQVKKFQFAPGISKNDCYPGVVWVKVKETHRHLFDSEKSRSQSRSRLRSKSITPLAPVNSLSSMANAPQQPKIDLSLYYQVMIDPADPVDERINALYTTGYFEKVEPSYKPKPLAVPNDPSIASQYYLDMINAYEAWDITEGSESVVLAIIDTGGDLVHPEIQNKLYIDPNEPIDGLDNNNDGYIDNYRGWDFSGTDASLIGTPGYKGDNDPSIVKGVVHAHGTMVAGCAAASVNNAIGIAGVGNKTKLLFLKHFADSQAANSGDFSTDPYLGVIYAATHGAKIINCSWGTFGASTIYADIIRFVTEDRGCLVVAAAGNSNSEIPLYPASYNNVLSVASSDNADLRWQFTSYGKNVDITAPGRNIYTTSYNNTYTTESGTSLSAPIVAGAAALVWAKNPGFTAMQVAEQLRATADPSFYALNPAYINKLGKGRLDVFQAVSIETPSVRASNLSFVNAQGKMPEPGENARLYFDFTNYLKSTTALQVTLTSTSPFLSIVDGDITLGVIPTMGIMKNAAQPFELVLSSSTPLDKPIEVLLTYTDGSYSDYQTMTIQFPLYIDVKDNNITTSVTSIGRIGFANTQEQTQGSGFVYDGNPLLYEMGLIMGTSGAQLYNNVRSINGSFDQDFTASSKIEKITPGQRSYSEVFGSFRNAATVDQASLVTSYRSLVWKKEATGKYNNFIILEYKIKNTSANEINNFYAGLFADWDIAFGGSGDKADWHSETRMGYVHSLLATEKPHAAIQLLKGTPNYYAIDNDHTIGGNPFGLYDGFTDQEKFTSVSSGFSKISAGDPFTGNDVSHTVAAGPHIIPAGGEITIAFALHAAPDLSQLITSAKYADSVYNFTFNAPLPVVALSEGCYGKAAVINATGALKYKLYKDFTGGLAIDSGSQVVMKGITKDTVMYVSNAENSYESIRVPASIKVNPNPEASFSHTFLLGMSTEPIFVEESKGAVSWLWDFGDGSTSTEKDAQHDFTSEGIFKVLLTVTSNKGCQDTTSRTYTIIISSTGEGISDLIEVYPNPVQHDVLELKFLNANAIRAKVSVKNIHGQVVKQVSVSSLLERLDLSDLSAGTYLIEIHSGERAGVVKIVKH